MTEAEAYKRLDDLGCEPHLPLIRSGTGTYWYRKREEKPAGAPDGWQPPRRRGFLFPLPDPSTGWYSKKVVEDAIQTLKL